MSVRMDPTLFELNFVTYVVVTRKGKMMILNGLNFKCESYASMNL